MRVFALLVLVTSGCSRWVGVDAARRDVLNDALQAQRFPVSPEEAALRINDQRIVLGTRCERLPTGELRCGGCLRTHCFELLEDRGSTQVRLADGFTEAELAALWRPLDPLGLEQTRAGLATRVEGKLREQEAAFEPRFGLTAGVLAGLSTDGSSVGVGARVGVRRWHTIDLLSHAAFEYRYRGDHELSLRFGLEVARWTEGRFWSGLGVPPASVSMFAGPVLRVPAARAGVRVGVGLHITDWKNAPMFLEAFAETLFVGDASRVTGVLTYGIGI